MPLPTPAQIMPLFTRITAFIMTLSVGDNYIPKAADCVVATGSGCFSIFINGNLALMAIGLELLDHGVQRTDLWQHNQATHTSAHARTHAT